MILLQSAPTLVKPRLWAIRPAATDAPHLHRGLVWLVAPGASWTQEIIHRQAGSLFASGAWDGVTERGPALRSSSTTNGGAQWPFPRPLETITNRFSIAVWLDPSALVGYSSLLSIPYRNDGSWSDPWVSLNLQRSASTTSLQLAMATGSGSAQSVASDTGAIDAADPLTLYGVTKGGSLGETVTFYRGAKQHGATKSTTGASINWGARSPICLLQRSSSNNGEGISGTSPLAAIWSRELTAQEWAEFAHDPFAMLRPRARRLFVDVAGGGGGGGGFQPAWAARSTITLGAGVAA